MLGELVVNLLGYPVGGALAGAFIGVFTSLTATQVQINESELACAQYRRCQNDIGMCALADNSQSVYASMNATTIQALTALSTQTRQQSIVDQIESVRSECEWSQRSCPNPDPDGVAACARFTQAWNAFPPVAIKALVGTIAVCAGTGLIIGTVQQIRSCAQKRGQRY